MTNLELITQALRKIGVIDAFRPASAEDAALGLQELNNLMADLEADTVDLGYFTQTSVNDDLPLDDRDSSAILPLLAVSLSGAFPSSTISPALAFQADKNRSRLLRDAVLASAQEQSLKNMPLGVTGYYDITTSE
jgi:hypothetical protein